ncbi:predicted protein [Plenodomus lingam JN3]|uniref:Predicted protein n=1 Tax=Leptosphaeria maculans (strain JN3 / isolate v23.1.3 / race Av1-4-5-6-7-8) TaxID=985895 RepID=E4ZKD3_LEPMJ|nr:predicted protein [Plenodomus lingam JN3]CBX91728.1 predicted protein [Plenodomus lingam JN3]
MRGEFGLSLRLVSSRPKKPWKAPEAITRPRLTDEDEDDDDDDDDDDCTRCTGKIVSPIASSTQFSSFWLRWASFSEVHVYSSCSLLFWPWQHFFARRQETIQICVVSSGDLWWPSAANGHTYKYGRVVPYPHHPLMTGPYLSNVASNQPRTTVPQQISACSCVRVQAFQACMQLSTVGSPIVIPSGTVISTQIRVLASSSLVDSGPQAPAPVMQNRCSTPPSLPARLCCAPRVCSKRASSPQFATTPVESPLAAYSCSIMNPRARRLSEVVPLAGLRSAAS